MVTDNSTSRTDRLAYLASQFAAGELDEEELAELYDALRAPGEAGKSAARIAWETLGAFLDVRTVLSTRFQDTVRLRVETGDDADDETAAGFLGGVMAKLGLGRPRLEAVAIPIPAAPPGSLRRWGLVVGLPLVLAALAGVWLLRPPRVAATVEAVNGFVSVEGRHVRDGDTVGSRPLIAADGSTLTLRWPQGDSMRIMGPANCVPHAGGASLTTGAALIETRTPMTVGLPDGQLAIKAGSRVLVVAAKRHSLVGMLGGSATLGVGDGAQRTTLAAGQAAAGPGASFPWQTEMPWVNPPPKHGPTEGRHLLRPPHDAKAWRLTARLLWSDKKGSIRFLAGAAAAMRPALVLQPGIVRLEPLSGPPDTVRLDGAPLLERTLTIEATPDAPPVLTIDGLARPLALPFAHAPQAIDFAGQAHLVDIQFHTGPPPVSRLFP